MNKINSKRKPVLLYILIFSVFCAGILFSGCSNSSSGDDEDYGGLTQATITGRSYVPSGLTGSFGSRLATQIADKTSTYDSACVNYFVTDDLLKNDTNLTNFKLLVKHLLSGKTVIFVEPTYKALQAVDLGLAIIAGYTTEEFKKMLPELSSFSNDAFSYIRQVSDSTDSFFSASVTDKGEIPVYDAVAIRGPQIRYIENIKQSVKELNDANPDSTAIEVNDSLYNLFLPDFASWLNDYENSRAVRDALYTRGIDGLSINGNSTATDKILTANEITDSFIAFAPSKDSSDQEKMSVNITTYYWSVSKTTEGEAVDYLLFDQEITYFNQELNCNIDEKTDCWYDRYGYESIYGPYFASSKVSNYLCALNENKVIEFKYPSVYNPSPLTDNNTTTYTKGFDFSLSAGLSALINTSKCGVSAGPSISFGFSKSTTNETKDLATVYAEDYGGVTWTWSGNIPKIYVSWYLAYHKQAPDILRSTLVLQPSWRWELKDGERSNDYLLATSCSVYVNLLEYTIGGYDSNISNETYYHKYFPICAPTRSRTTVNLYVDWDGRKTATESDIRSIDNLLENIVDSYYPTYCIMTKDGNEIDVDLQVSILSEDLCKNIIAQKNALKANNFKGLYTFTFVDQNDRIIPDSAFTVDFSN